MALGAIGREVGTNAIFQTPGRVRCGCQGAQRINARDIAGKVTCLAESGYLIVRNSTVIELPIELPGIEAKGPARYLRMTTQTFLAAGIMPNLRVRFALILNVNVFVQAP